MLGIIMHDFNANTQEAGRSAQGQPGLHDTALSQRQNTQKICLLLSYAYVCFACM